MWETFRNEIFGVVSAGRVVWNSVVVGTAVLPRCVWRVPLVLGW